MTLQKPRKRSPPPSADKEVKPIPTVFKQLIKTMESDNPEQFRLPEHVRTFFTGGTSIPVVRDLDIANRVQSGQALEASTWTLKRVGPNTSKYSRSHGDIITTSLLACMPPFRCAQWLIPRLAVKDSKKNAIPTDSAMGKPRSSLVMLVEDLPSLSAH